MTAARKSTARNNTKRIDSADAIDVEIKKMQEQLHMDTETFWERMGFRPYSVQSTITKLIFRVAFYALGVTAALYSVSLLSAALLGFGWPMFLVAVIELFTLILAVIGSWVLSDKVVNYVAEGHVSRDIKRVGGWIASKFGDGSTFIKSRMSMH